MSKFSGSWAKGFASTFDPVGGINLGLQWAERRKAQEEVDKAKEEFKLNTQKYATAFDTAYKDGLITPTERSSMVALTMVLGTEFGEQWTEFDKGYLKMEEDQRKAGLGEIDAALKMYMDFDPTDSTALLETLENIQSNTRYDSVKIRAKLAIDMINKQQAKPEQPELFQSLEDAEKAYPDKVIKFSASAGGYYPEGDITPSKPLEYKQKMEDIDKGVVNGDWTYEEGKAMKQRLLGGAAPVSTEAKTMSIGLVEDTREKMAKAKTWDGVGGAKSILEDAEGANWKTDQIKVAEKQWTAESIEGRKAAIDNTRKTIDEMLGDKTWRPTDEYEMMYDGKPVTKTKAEWYKILYDQYVKQIKSLGDLDNIDEYAIPSSPDELKTVGWKWKATSEDIMRSDMESVW